MPQEYDELVRQIMSQPLNPSLDFEIDSNRYYLTGEITHLDLAQRNQTGFVDWKEASAFALQYGYVLKWEVR
jgi:hypothetical protein